MQITSMRFIGDVHGNMKIYEDMISTFDGIKIQVGDMGVGFVETNIISNLNEKYNARFIAGNHDSPNTCKIVNGFISNGTVEKISNITIMYIGGAKSIDVHSRTEGVDWWRDEEMTYSEWNLVLDIYEKNKPDVLVTHDCPLSIAGKIFGKNRVKYQEKSITQQALDAALELHKPRYHIFGHWHCHADVVIDGVRYICVDKNSYVDIGYDESKNILFRQS